MTLPPLDPLDLAALLCSRVCHDIISPVGAIINGLEVLEEEKDAEMRGFALDLIKKSAEQASARLQFSRLAFGAAGSAGALIDTSDAETVARSLLGTERTVFKWDVPAVLMPKNKVKLILNLCLIGAAAIARGGILEVTVSGMDGAERIRVAAKGQGAKLSSHLPPLIAGVPAQAPSTPQDIQAYYTGLVAKAAGLAVTASAGADLVAFEAEPLPGEKPAREIMPQPAEALSDTALRGPAAELTS
ncbi:MAG TPA: histidine phosphotransferase family protein [Methylocella sp.]|nr:histidine phosphotransferase family protein [Methylocella sp.]